MNYLYYSLSLVYTKILYVQKHYPPVINISGVLALLLTFLVVVILNYSGICVYDWERNYYFIAYALLSISIWRVLYLYYTNKENEIIKKINSKSQMIKVFIVVSSYAFMGLIVYLWSKISCS